MMDGVIPGICNELGQSVKKILNEKDSAEGNVTSWRSLLKISIIKFLGILEEEKTNQTIKDGIYLLLQSIKKINLVLETAKYDYLKDLCTALIKEMKMLLQLESQERSQSTTSNANANSQHPSQETKGSQRGNVGDKGSQSVTSNNTKQINNNTNQINNNTNQINNNTKQIQYQLPSQNIENEIRSLIRTLFQSHADNNTDMAITTLRSIAEKINLLRQEGSLTEQNVCELNIDHYHHYHHHYHHYHH
jgi:hypothetical protein